MSKMAGTEAQILPGRVRTLTSITLTIVMMCLWVNLLHPCHMVGATVGDSCNNASDCSSASEMCVDNNCTAKPSYGDSCNNTECSHELVCTETGVCGCDTNNYTIDNVTCILRLSYGESCNNTECSRELVCTETGVCECDINYYTIDNIICIPRLSSRESYNNTECSHERVCTETGVCGIDTNNYTIGNITCILRPSYGDSCNNTECSHELVCTETGVCGCDTNNYTIDNVTCILRPSYGDSCYNTECSHELVCTETGVCGCDKNNYTIDNITCIPRPSYGDSCYNTECSHELVCTETGVCGCDKNNYTIDNITCIPRPAYGDSCNNTECLNELVCTENDVCGCDANNYTIDNVTCIPIPNLGEDCTESGQCLVGECPDATGVAKICQCNTLQYEHNGVCKAIPNLGEDCTESGQCLVGECPDATGVAKICQCNTLQYEHNGVCKAIPNLGEDCTESGQCLVGECPDATGVAKICQCNTLQYEHNGVCKAIPNLGEDCTESGQCLVGECPDATGVAKICQCNTLQYEHNGVCKAIPNLGEDCTESGQCLVGECPDATGVAKICQCNTLQYEHNGVCKAIDNLKVTVTSSNTRTTDSVTLNWTANNYFTGVTYKMALANGSKEVTASQAGGTVTGLIPGTQNDFKITSIAPRNSYEPEKKTKVTETGVWTLPATPGQVYQFEEVSAPTYNISFTQSEGNVQYYIFTLFRTSSSSNKTISPSTPSVTFNLTAGTSYSYKIIAYNGNGDASTPSQGTLTTNTTVADDLKAVNVTLISNKGEGHVGLRVEWVPGERTGLTSYYITLMEETGRDNGVFEKYDELVVTGYDNRHVTVNNLLAYWNYKVYVTARTSEGNSTQFQAGTKRTLTNVPGLVKSLSVQQDDTIAQELVITVVCPDEKERNGTIEKFVIRKTLLGGDTGTQDESQNYTVDAKSDCATSTYNASHVGGIFVERNYTFKVAAKNQDYFGEFSAEEILTVQARAPLLEESKRTVISAVDKDRSAETEIKVKICATCVTDEKQGTVKVVGLLVCKKGCSSSRRKKRALNTVRDVQNSPTWAEAHKSDFNVQYRATPDNWLQSLKDNGSSDYTYTIGNDKECSDKIDTYCNGPLPDGEEFEITLIVCTDGGCGSKESSFKTKASEDDSDTAVIIGAVVGVVAALVVVGIIAFILWRRRSRGKSTHRASNPLWDLDKFKEKEHITQKRPVKLCNFKDHVTKLHKDSNLLFQDEFEDIKKLSERFNHTCDEAKKEGNRVKNRYVDILPYDHSRTKLETQPEDDDTMDFINANYIGGLNSVREYIASQGPMHCTMPDFWRMVWEQKSKVIVMLSDLQENGKRKVDLYWPENLNEPINYGNVTVEMTNFSQLNKYIIRNFKISKGEEFRKVTHFFLPGWWDFSANLTVDDVLEFAKLVRQEATPANTGPIVVHCSAGVGRTGTFIALDYFMQHVDRLSLEDEIDIFSFVMAMRKNRPRMVQAETQYIFIFDALNEIIQKKIKLEEEHMYANGPSQNQNEGDLYANMGKQEQPEENLYANTGAATVSYDNKAFEPDYDTSSEKDEKKDTPTTVL